MLSKMPKIGDFVKITVNTCSHNYTLGKLYKVHAFTGSECFSAIDPVTTWVGNSLTVKDVDMASEINTKDDLTKQLDTLNSQRAAVQAKLNWLNESGDKSFKETEFKVWNILQELKTTKSNYAKAKEIAKLIDLSR